MIPTRADATRLIDLLTPFESTGERRGEWIGTRTCPRCKAGPGEPCRKPNGDPLVKAHRKSGWHAPRMDAAIRVARKCPTWLRGDLLEPDCSPVKVHDRLISSKFYRELIKHGLLTLSGQPL